MRPDRYYPRPRVGDYQPDPLRPAGDGWCEAIAMYPQGLEHRCLTFGRFERDGHRVCGLHTPDRCQRIVFHVDGDGGGP